MRDVRRGWKWVSRNLGVSVNIRAWSMGVYATRSEGEEEGMNERVSMRQAWVRELVVVYLGEGCTHKFGLVDHWC